MIFLLLMFTPCTATLFSSRKCAATPKKIEWKMSLSLLSF